MVPLSGLPQASLQGQGNTCKGKYLWADFRDVISNKRMMRLFCCILMGFILMWGLQVIRIIRSCPGWDYYICRRRTYANSLIFLSWFVLLSLTLSIVPGLSYAQYRLILILGYHLTLSHLMHTPLKKQSQYSGPIPNTQGSPHHSSH